MAGNEITLDFFSMRNALYQAHSPHSDATKAGARAIHFLDLAVVRI